MLFRRLYNWHVFTIGWYVHDFESIRFDHTYIDQFEFVTIVDTRNPCFTLTYCRIFGYVCAQKAHFYPQSIAPQMRMKKNIRNTKKVLRKLKNIQQIYSKFGLFFRSIEKLAQKIV